MIAGFMRPPENDSYQSSSRQRHHRMAAENAFHEDHTDRRLADVGPEHLGKQCVGMVGFGRAAKGRLFSLNNCWFALDLARAPTPPGVMGNRKHPLGLPGQGFEEFAPPRPVRRR